MKSILLASASIVAFAGAAAAEVTFSGSAELGYNDTDIDADGNDSVAGFYSDLDLTVTLSQTLDNGLTVGAAFAISDVFDGSMDSNDYELFVTSDNAGLYFGDTEHAAIGHWSEAGDMAQDNFNEVDGETVLRGDMTFGSVSASVSYALFDSAGAAVTDDINNMGVGVTADLGSFTVMLAYQEEGDDGAYDGVTGEQVLGLAASASLGGADLTFAYADNSTTGENSIGLGVSYPAGPVTISAAYVVESDAALDDYWEIGAAYAQGPVTASVSFDSTDDWSLEGSYDVGNGLVVYAGMVDAGDDLYIGGAYDLGGGASLLVSYADDGDGDEADGDDDIGANDYQVGTTVEVSFEF